jgi:hypothetical protein
MATSLVPGLGQAGSGSQTSHYIDEFEEALHLARALCTRISMPIEGEQSHGVRLRLVRAQALGIVDLLTDIAGDRMRNG